LGTEFEDAALQIDGFLTLVSNEPGEYVSLLDGTLYSNVPDSMVQEILTQVLRNWQWLRDGEWAKGDSTAPDPVGRKTRRVEGMANRINCPAPVLSRSVRVPSPDDIARPLNSANTFDDQFSRYTDSISFVKRLPSSLNLAATGGFLSSNSRRMDSMVNTTDMSSGAMCSWM